MLTAKTPSSAQQAGENHNLLMTTPTTPTSSKLAPSNEGASNDTKPSLLQLFGQCREWPQEIIIEPCRLSCGVFGDTEGDINAAYCADTFPKIKTFAHDGNLFTNTGGSDNYAFCYPLIPSAEYNGASKTPYSYEGESVTFKGQPFKLGPKIKFASRDRTIEEETDLLQRQYAYGGYFVSGKTYRELLLEFLDEEKIKPNLETAIKQELEKGNLPNTQAEMRLRFDKIAQPPEPDNDDSGFSQQSLPGF